MNSGDLREQHTIRIEHMKLQTLAFNIFRNVSLNNSEYVAFIEPLYHLQRRYLHRPDILVLEKRRKKVYFHWIEVKSGESKKFWKEIPKNIESLNKYFQNNIFSHLVSIFPKISKMVSIDDLNKNNIKQDYSVFIKAIYSDRIPTDADVAIFSGSFVDGKVRVLTKDARKQVYWTAKFFRTVRRMRALNLPIIFTPSYIFSLLFTDAIKLFYTDIFEDAIYINILKTQKNPAEYNIANYMVKYYNYPVNLANLYASVVISLLKEYKIFKIRKKRLKIDKNKLKGVEYPILIKKLEKGLKNPHIQTDSLILDYLTENKIPVVEVNSKKTLMNYFFN